jgi:hypothetical protein
VNTTLITLNLEGNKLGPEGGKAIAKSLEVMRMICCFRRYHCSHNNEIDFLGLLQFLLCTGQQEPHRSQFGVQQAWPGGRKSDRQIASSNISIFIVSALLITTKLIFFVFPYN